MWKQFALGEDIPIQAWKTAECAHLHFMTGRNTWHVI